MAPSFQTAQSSSFFDTTESTWGLKASNVLPSSLTGAGIKVAIIDSKSKELSLEGEALQLMEMAKFRIWQTAGDKDKMKEVGEALIKLAPESSISTRVRATLKRLK